MSPLSDGTDELQLRNRSGEYRPLLFSTCAVLFKSDRESGNSMRLTRDEILLIASVMIALLLGSIIKHYRDRHRLLVRPHPAPPAEIQGQVERGTASR